MVLALMLALAFSAGPQKFDVEEYAMRFGKVDTNHDGILTWAEADKAFKETIMSQSAAVEAAITQEHLDEARGIFGNIDADSNGRVSMDEFAAHAKVNQNFKRIAHERQFLLADANSDNTLSAEEFGDLHASHRSPRADEYEKLKVELFMEKNDVDKSGDFTMKDVEALYKLPAVETKLTIPPISKSQFVQHDGNGDGKLDEDEVHGFIFAKHLAAKRPRDPVEVYELEMRTMFQSLRGVGKKHFMMVDKTDKIIPNEELTLTFKQCMKKKKMCTFFLKKSAVYRPPRKHAEL
jgi:Ca2+-binding EF-hand superfamily protein